MTAGQLREKLQKRQSWGSFFLGILLTIVAALGVMALSDKDTAWHWRITGGFVFLAVVTLIARDARQRDVLTEMLGKHEVAWRKFCWTLGNFRTCAGELFSNEAEQSFVKELVANSRSLGPYSLGELLGSINTARTHAGNMYFLEGLVGIIEGHHLERTSEGYVWSSAVCDRYFELHPMPGWFNPEHPAVKSALDEAAPSDNYEIAVLGVD